MQTSIDNEHHVVIIITNDTIQFYPQCTERFRNKMKLVYSYTVPSCIQGKMMSYEIDEAKEFIGFNKLREYTTKYDDGIIISYDLCNRFLNYLHENGLQYKTAVYKFFELAARDEHKESITSDIS